MGSSKVVGDFCFRSPSQSKQASRAKGTERACSPVIKSTDQDEIMAESRSERQGSQQGKVGRPRRGYCPQSVVVGPAGLGRVGSSSARFF